MPKRLALNVSSFNTNYQGEDKALSTSCIVKSAFNATIREPFTYIQLSVVDKGVSESSMNASRNVRFYKSCINDSCLEAKNTRPIEMAAVAVSSSITTPYTIPTLSEAYNMHQRQITAKIEMYIDGEHKPPIILDRHLITSFDVLEECKADAQSPLGSVSSNELNISLMNINDIFNPNNIKGPYYGKLMPKIKIKPFVGIYIYNETHKDGYVLWDDLGTYYTGDWLPSYASLDVALTCYDRFFFDSGLSLVGFSAQVGVTLEEYINSLFSYLNLDLPIIDEELKTIRINAAGFVGDTFGQTLQEISKATGCFIYIDRYNNYVFRIPFNTTDFHHTVTDSNQLYEIDAPVRYLDAFSVVILGINEPVLEENVELTNLSKVKIDGSYAKYNIKLNEGLAVSARVSIEDTNGAPIEGATGSVELIDPYRVNVFAEGLAEDANIKVLGNRYIDSINEINYINNTIYQVVGENTINLSSSLLQDDTHAKEYMFRLFNQLCNPRQKMSLVIKGMPSIVLSEKVQVTDANSKVNEKMFVYRNSITFDGGLEQVVEGLRYATENVDPLASSGLKNKFNRSPFNRPGTYIGGI